LKSVYSEIGWQRQWAVSVYDLTLMIIVWTHQINLHNCKKYRCDNNAYLPKLTAIEIFVRCVHASVFYTGLRNVMTPSLHAAFVSTHWTSLLRRAAELMDYYS